MSCERALYLDQWKSFSENYEAMRVLLWLVYKLTDFSPSLFKLKRGILPLSTRYVS